MLFVIVSVIYRPIEQLLSRTIADRRARGFETGHPLRTPLLIQAGFALAFLIVALALKGPIQDDLFDGSSALYWVLVVAVLAYAASYFARGWLAGHQWFALYGALVFMEASSRLLFALAVAVGLAYGSVGRGDGHGRRAVRLADRRPVGVLAAPEGGSSARPSPTSRRSASLAAGASRSRCSASWSPSRRCSTAASWPPTSTPPTPRSPATSSARC